MQDQQPLNNECPFCQVLWLNGGPCHEVDCPINQEQQNNRQNYGQEKEKTFTCG